MNKQMLSHNFNCRFSETPNINPSTQSCYGSLVLPVQQAYEHFYLKITLSMH